MIIIPALCGLFMCSVLLKREFSPTVTMVTVRSRKGQILCLALSMAQYGYQTNRGLQIW